MVEDCCEFVRFVTKFLWLRERRMEREEWKEEKGVKNECVICEMRGLVVIYRGECMKCVCGVDCNGFISSPPLSGQVIHICS